MVLTARVEAVWVTQRDTVADVLRCNSASFQASPYPDRDPTAAGTLSEYRPRKIICLEQNKLQMSISEAALET